MNNFSTPTFGYKILPNNHIIFYHKLISKVSVETLFEHLTNMEYLKVQDDGSMLILPPPNTDPQDVVEKILSFFDSNAEGFLDTPTYYYKYKIAPHLRQSLKQWAISFEGCIALMLTSKNDWHLINSEVGGIYLCPFTLLLYASYPKIIHPVTLKNYEERAIIEQKTSLLVRKALSIMSDAQPGYEGMALLSLVEEKTHLSAKDITSIINQKTLGITTPHYSPFFANI